MHASGLSALATGLDFPTGVAVDGAGRLHVCESGLPFGGAVRGGRIWRIEDGDQRTLLLDGLAPPVTGICWHDGELFISEGGAGRVIARADDGTVRSVIDGMPGPGNYHTNMAVVGPDQMLYFSQGAMTNLGIIGLDAYELGWLRRLPHAHDVPGLDVVLAGVNVTTSNPLLELSGETATTGAFVPFGISGEKGRRVRGQLPCTSAVMRCRLDGTGLELVAWGLRNAFGLGFLPDGRLIAVDQGADDRGSRPIGGVPELLFEVESGAWYGWPDFIGAVPVTDVRFKPQRGRQPEFVLANHDELPPPHEPVLALEPHAAATKFAVVPDGQRYAGQMLLALFGDEAPMTVPAGHPKAGRALVRVDPAGWTVHRMTWPGPEPGLRRPIDVAFDGAGVAYVLDFGAFEMSERGVAAESGSGVLWRWKGWPDL